MKQFLKITVLAFIIALGSAFQNRASAQYADEDVSYQTFYDELSPYGQWIEYPDYGYVWSPDQGPDFQPYRSNGHWVYSDDYDWIWVSDYDWGWAPFHYGRWFMDPSYGWLWVPGYEWAPAWVAWRSGGDYYGWAPLRPGISINIGFSLGNYYAPDDYWCFTPRRYITSPRVYDYCIDRRQNVTIIHNTVIINNYSRSRNIFVTGPRRAEAETYCGRINPVQFRSSSRPGRASFRNNEVAIYNPRVQRDDNRKFSPGHFDRYKQDLRSNQERITRNDNNQQRNNIFRRDNRKNNADRSNNNGNVRPDNRPVRQGNNNNDRVRPQTNGSNETREYRGLDPRRRQQAANQPNHEQQERRNDNVNNNAQRNSPSIFNRERTNNNNNAQRNSPSIFNRERANDNNNGQRNSPTIFNRERTNNNNNGQRNSPTIFNRERTNERRQDDNNRSFQNNRQPQQQQAERQNRTFQREQRPQMERQQQPRGFDRKDNGNRDQNNSGPRGRNGFRKKD